MFSTVLSPILVSLRAKTENIALRYAITLTVEFEKLLKTFPCAIDALSEKLLHKYMQVMPQLCVERLERNSRMTWIKGRKAPYSKDDPAQLRLALETLIELGPHQFYPVDRIDPNWSPTKLQRVIEVFDKEAQSSKSSQIGRYLVDLFQSATGENVGSLEHKAQIMQIYLQARLASLECSSASQSRTINRFK